MWAASMQPTRKWRSRMHATSIPVDRKVPASPDEKEALFDPADDKVYRHPTFYDLPDEVKNM